MYVPVNPSGAGRKDIVTWAEFLVKDFSVACTMKTCSVVVPLVRPPTTASVSVLPTLCNFVEGVQGLSSSSYEQCQMLFPLGVAPSPCSQFNAAASLVLAGVAVKSVGVPGGLVGG